MPSVLETILGAAESALGNPYVWGGNSLATGVDCSGLVQQAFRAAGIELPRVSADQARTGQVVSWEDMQPGDLIWLDNSSRNNGADHIGIYIGNGLMIESPNKDAPTRVAAVPSEQARMRQKVGVTRVIGVVPQGPPKAVPLGGNTDRTYTTAAVTGKTSGLTPSAAGGYGAASPSVIESGDPGGGVGDEITPDTPPEQIEAYIKEHYGAFADFMGDEAIKWILYDAAINERGTAEFESAIQNTRYWQTHGPESRAFDVTLATDPKAAEQQVNAKKDELGDLLSRNDIVLSDAELGELAKKAIREAWTPEDTNEFLANHVRSLRAQPGVQGLGGEMELQARDLGVISANYMVPMTTADLEDWALRIADGSETAESFTAYVMDLSLGRFQNDPGVTAAIQAGRTPMQYFAPIRNTIAETLELNPEAVDLFGNHKYAAVTGFYDAENKVTRSMTLGEAAQWSRDQDEYKHTRQYKETEANFGVDLLREFGAIA